MIAALYVHSKGAYFGLPNLDPWDEKRDARKYAGPFPVVAHPPCSRWCRLAFLVQARHGYRIGDDGGCFAAALAAVRAFGGILEHPAFSIAWKTFGLAKPRRHGGWTRTACGGYTAHVEQGRYGHVAKKATWLYAFNTYLPQLIWGSDPDHKSKALVSWCGNHTSKFETRPRAGKAAAATPPAFRELLLSIASSAYKLRVAT